MTAPDREDGEALTPDGNYGADYTLVAAHKSVWIRVDPPKGSGGAPIAVQVTRHDDGVSIALYPSGSEALESLTETWATYAEAEGVLEDEKS